MRLYIKSFKYLLINIITCFILCLSSLDVFAQLIDTEQNPPSVKWQQIETENFNIIYPEEFLNEAQRMANTLEFAIPHVRYSLNKKTRKISILLQNRGVQSNGFVQLAPRKSVFFTTPPQEMDYQDWLNSLVVHEMRHVVQMDKMSGYLHAPFFEQLALALFGVPLPPWFYEGDAVVTETMLTSAGRGRLPSWEMPLRTNLLSGRRYSYQKDYLGSLKNITPGYYELGYFMNSKLRREYPGAPDSLLTHLARNPIWPYNFSRNWKRITGFSTRGWHRETMDELQQTWKEQYARNMPDKIPVFPLNNKERQEDFLLPQTGPDGQVLAIQKNLLRVPQLVSISPDNTVRKILATGIQTTPNFSYGGNKLVWDEMRYNKRFYKETFNVINLYDLTTKTYRQLTRKTRFFSPAIDTAGEQITAVEIGLDNQVALVLLDISGKLLSRYISPERMMLQTPSFNTAGSKVIATGLSQEGTALVELDLKTGIFSLLLSKQSQQIERPVYAGDDIVFKAHYNGIDNIYRLAAGSGKITQLTNVPFGAFNPSYHAVGNELLFNNYQADGNSISRMKLADARNIPVSQVKNTFINYAQPILRQEMPPVNFDSISRTQYTSKPYRALTHLLNFHSLSVNNGDFSSFSNFKPGIQWLSDDLLNTTSVKLGYEYDPDIRSNAWSAFITYQGWYPKISASWINRGQLSNVKIRSTDEQFTALRWREDLAEFTVEIPFRFTRLNHISNIGFNASTSYTSRYDLSLPQLRNRFTQTIRFPIVYQLYMNHNLQRSVRDLAPRWGQNLSLLYRSSPFNNTITGDLLAINSSFYFPGLLPNHSLQVRLSYQQRNGIFDASNDIPLVSGYDRLRPTRPDNTLLLNYRFPLTYPDWEIGNLAYLKRLRAGFFADFENVDNRSGFSPRTLGAELYTDLNLLRFYLPNFNAGVKLIYVNEAAPKRWLLQYGVSYSY